MGRGQRLSDSTPREVGTSAGAPTAAGGGRGEACAEHSRGGGLLSVDKVRAVTTEALGDPVLLEVSTASSPVFREDGCTSHPGGTVREDEGASQGDPTGDRVTAPHGTGNSPQEGGTRDAGTLEARDQVAGTQQAGAPESGAGGPGVDEVAMLNSDSKETGPATGTVVPLGYQDGKLGEQPASRAAGVLGCAAEGVGEGNGAESRPSSAAVVSSSELFLSPFANAPPATETPPYLSPQSTWERVSLLTLATVPEGEVDDVAVPRIPPVVPSEDPAAGSPGPVQDAAEVMEGREEVAKRVLSTPAKSPGDRTGESESPTWRWLGTSPAPMGVQAELAALNSAAPTTPTGKESQNSRASSGLFGQRTPGPPRVRSSSSLARSSSTDSRSSLASSLSLDGNHRRFGRAPARVRSHSSLQQSVLPRHKTGVAHSASYSGLESLMPLSPGPWSQETLAESRSVTKPFDLLLHGVPPPGDLGGPLGWYM